MAGFFSVRLAPGVRLSASPRGLRAHIGPRGARIHLGGGRAGMSTGSGPFTIYEPLGGSRRRTTRSTRPAGPSRSQIALADKARQAELIRAALRAILDVSKQEFSAQPKPVAVAEGVPELAVLVAEEEHKALEGIGVFKRSARKAIKSRARELAATRLQRVIAEAESARDTRQRDIDAFWRLLAVNDQEAVVTMLGHVFEDNEAPASAVGVRGDEVQLAVLVPPESVVPDRLPATTEAGNLSLRKMSRADFAAWDRALVAGHVLATVKEAFASAEGIGSAAVVALRDLGPDVYGAARVAPLLAVRFARSDLDGVQWSTAAPWDVLNQAGTDLTINVRGSQGDLSPLDLTSEPELAALVSAIDIDDLA